MNYELSLIPQRTPKPRESGLTMVMDKGLSQRELEDMLSTSAEYIDIVKLGWATSYVTPGLAEKPIKVLAFLFILGVRFSKLSWCEGNLKSI